jgi:putative endonuclease
LKPDKDWVVYLVRCSDKSLYCGITNDLQNRLDAHNHGKGAKYTRSRTPVVLLGTSLKMTRSDALKLEHRIKMKPARRKLTELVIEKAPRKMENELIQEIQMELLSVVKSIQQFTDSLITIVTAVEKLAQADSSPGAKAKRAPARKKVIVKNGVVEKIKRIPANQIVYDIIQQSARGMDTAALMKATGYNQRKIHNITFRLKKEGRIKNVGRGVYKKV